MVTRRASEGLASASGYHAIESRTLIKLKGGHPRGRKAPRRGDVVGDRGRVGRKQVDGEVGEPGRGERQGRVGIAGVIDRDGARSGYDIQLTSRVSRAVRIPVVASGGAGSAADVVDAFVRGGAQAALLAGVLHDETTDIRSVKSALAASGIRVRMGTGRAA